MIRDKVADTVEFITSTLIQFASGVNFVQNVEDMAVSVLLDTKTFYFLLRPYI
jgi:hypothetical protein